MSARDEVLTAGFTPPSASAGPLVGGGRRRGVRTRPTRPGRVAGAVVLLVSSVLLAVWAFWRVGQRREVLVVTRDVLAGEQLSDRDLAVVSIGADDPLVVLTPASQRAAVVGEFAKVRLLRGSLLVEGALQPGRLVDPSRAVVAIGLSVTQAPIGLREGSRVLLTVTAAGPGSPPVLVEGFAVAPPRFDGGSAAGSLSVQVPLDRVALVGSAAKVSVSLIDPSAVLPAAGG